MLNTGAVREWDKWLKHAGSMGTRESVVILCVYVVLLQMDDPVLICLCMFGRNDIGVLPFGRSEGRPRLEGTVGSQREL